MLSERAVKCFADIISAIDLIKNWTLGASSVEAALEQNTLLRSAIERQILIISEAAIRLDKLDPNITAAYAPEIDWPGIRGVGNFIRHKYDDLDTQVIADVLTNRLDALRAACEQAIAGNGA
jgi:uncharacterized protein with HEPN domain